MTKPIPLPTQQELHELFDYSVITGELYWKKQISSRAVVGKAAGSANCRGYKVVTIARKSFQAQRIIWRLVTGEDPGALVVDHVNGDKLCNSWHNLRLATRNQNARNRRNTQGFHWNGRKYTACIKVDGVQKHLGSFDTEAEAVTAYKKASLELHGQFSSYSNE